MHKKTSLFTRSEAKVRFGKVLGTKNAQPHDWPSSILINILERIYKKKKKIPKHT